MIDLIFLISLHSLQEMIHSKEQQVWVWIVWWYMIDWFDLPNLTTFTTGSRSFCNTNSIILDSMTIVKWFDLIFLVLLHSMYYHLHSFQQKSLLWRVISLLTEWFDLPNLTEFIVENGSFIRTRELSIESVMINSLFIWSS